MQFIEPAPRLAIVCVISCLLTSAAVAEMPYEITWGQQVGSIFTEVGYSVATDLAGNSYISGYTDGSIARSNSGDSDILLAKYNPAGNPVWVRQIGETNGGETAYSIAADVSGNSYISGEINGNGFVSKYNTSGGLLWSRDIGTAGTDRSNGVAVDVLENVYATGYTFGSLANPNAGSSDAFLVKYDSLGNHLWSRQIGTSSTEGAASVAVDAAGNAFVAGYTGGNLDGLHPGQQGFVGFLLKYDTGGNLLWSHQYDVGSSFNNSVAVDPAGNAFVTGTTDGALAGPQIGFGEDAFLFKFDPAGNKLWSRQFGSSVTDRGYGVAIDVSGSAYVTGTTMGNLDGAHGSSFGTDAFIFKWTNTGDLLWSRQIGSFSEDLSFSIAVDAGGSAFITGSTQASFVGTYSGQRDAFLIKLSAPVPEPPSICLAAVIASALMQSRRTKRLERMARPFWPAPGSGSNIFTFVVPEPTRINFNIAPNSNLGARKMRFAMKPSRFTVLTSTP